MIIKIMEDIKNMNLNELQNNFMKNGNKREYWSNARTRLLPLLEISDFLNKNEENYSIEINKNDIILTCGNCKILFDFTQTVCRAESVLLKTEEEDWNFLQNFITDESVVFDIGANVGWFSINVSKLFPKSQIYAFEPLPSTFAWMKKNLDLNNTCVNIYNVGLSDTNKKEIFYLPAESEAASLKPIDDEFYTQEGNVGQKDIKKIQEEVECQIRSIDDFTSEHKIEKCDFMKIDVEGNELFTLRGGGIFISKTKPVIYCEMLRKHAKRFGYHPNEIIDFMKTIDYGCYEITNEKLAPFDTMTDETDQTNFFFIPNSKKEKFADLFL